MRQGTGESRVDFAAAMGTQWEALEFGSALEARRSFKLEALGVEPLGWLVDGESGRFVWRLGASASGSQPPDPPRVHERLVHTAPSVARSNAAGLLRDEPAESGVVSTRE